MYKQSLVLLLGWLLAHAPSAAAQEYQPNWASLDSRPTPAWFTAAKFGIFIHWGVYSVPAFADPDAPKEPHYAEWYWHSLVTGKEGKDPNVTATWKFHQRVYGAGFPYQDFAPMFHAELFDPAHWADIFARSGAKYVVLTSKHHEGFALWPSRESSAVWGRPWNSVEAGPRRDLVGDLTEAVRAKGLKMGFYYSLYEWYNPLWLTDRPRYVSRYMTPQFKDLVTRYRPSIIFADGEWELASSEWKSPELLAWLFNESPVREEVVINDRWGSETRHQHGGYWTTEYTAGMSDTAHPWEENRGMGLSYGYNRAERLNNYRTGRELVLMLVDTVSRGGNLLLDIGPAADGTIPVVMEERLLQMGSWLRINGEAIYGTHALKNPHQYTAGEVPKVEYNGRFRVPYDIAKLTEKPTAGQAAIEAFFTAKGNDTYVILPRWPERLFTVKGISVRATKSVTLLGSPTALRFKSNGDSVTVTVPSLPEELRTQPAWTLKLAR